MKRISLAAFILLLSCGVAFSWPWGGGGGGGGGVGGGTVTEVVGNAMIGVTDGTTTPGLSLTDNAITSAKLLDNTVALSKLNHTGTASNTTYFRGDGAWTPDLSANSLQAYGTNGLALGTSGTYGGKIVMKSGTGANTFLFTINASNFASDLAWTLPTAAPAGNDYLIRSSTAGVISYVDPATIGGVPSDTAYAGTWDGVTTIAPSKNAVYDEMELRAPKAVVILDNTSGPTAAQSYGSLNRVTGAITVLLPTAVAGMSTCVMDSGTAHDIIVDVQGGDTMTLNGTAQAAGVGITNAAGSTTGDIVCVVAHAANAWSTVGSQGSWASQ